MKYAIFADIHSNLEALEVVIEYYQKGKVDKYFCCGDLVGYGPNPNECIKKVRELNCIVVAGNHDWACVGLKDIAWFNEYAQAAILWTKEQLTPDNIDYLKSLLQVYQDENLTLVHGSPRKPIDEYLINLSQARENINLFPTETCFIGHSHTPFFYQRNPQGEEFYNSFRLKSSLFLPPKTKTIINVGSVGQPRDGNPQAACAIYDPEKREVYLARLPYNIPQVQEKMFKTKLPFHLIHRLTFGQ